jgi:hypothetical protein
MSEDLRRQQHELEREERRRADESGEPAEERTHQRRADKHAYLEDKLAEREKSEDG